MTNAELLSRVYNNPHDLDGVLHPDFVLRSPGDTVVAGTFYGVEGVVSHTAMLQELTGGTFNMALQGTFLADETWGLVVHRMTATRLGRQLDMWGFGLWRFSGGQLIEHWEGQGDPKQWEAFWS